MTTGEISAHFADIYGAAVSKDTVSRITDRVLEERTAWHRDVLGIWAGEGDGKSAKYWLSVLTKLKNRGVADISSWSATASRTSRNQWVRRSRTPWSTPASST